MSNPDFYTDIFYPLQDKVLKMIRILDTGFYLTGGTAASRGFLNHRYSDDLDFFINDDDHFDLWVSRIIHTLNQDSSWKTEVTMRDIRFARINLIRPDVTLKLEMVNDVPAHVGKIIDHPILGYMDTAENILANKVTAVIDREAPKDLADIWGFCTKMELSLLTALTDADSKAAGIFQADLGRVLCSVSEDDWKVVRWINPPPVDQFVQEVYKLGENLLLGI